ncbi:thioredoxin, mitochondrial-like [Homalodisca vitripennis]|uniref:thioredoxin, mitochondrial-like n=1 Tax=Homalodisca vitripennis TaxID=197043 RepID=UPI001EEBA917|nr:thioredoxin, mitochondrial-like [Homalodisca vitripennis]
MQTSKLFLKTNASLLSKSVSSPSILGLRNITITSKATKSFKIQDEKDFDERVKKSKTPVIVDFFATWCNPCKALTPRIESVVAEKEGRVVLAKVDIDEHSNLADDYDIKSVPVLLIMRNGKVEDRIVGLQDTDKLHKFVDSVISSK